MKHLILLILLVVSTRLNAQFPFIFEETTDTNEYVTSVIELQDGNYLAVIRQEINQSAGCKLIALSTTGEKVLIKNIYMDGILWISEGVETTDGILLLGTHQSKDSADFVAILLDDDLNIRKINRFPLGKIHSSGVYPLLLDSFLIVSGSVTRPEIGIYFGFMAKLKFDGTIINFKKDLFPADLVTNCVYSVKNGFICLGWKKMYKTNDDFLITGYDDIPYRLDQEGYVFQPDDQSLLIVGKKSNNIFFPPYEETQNIGIAVADAETLVEKKLFQIGMSKDTIDFPAFVRAISTIDKRQYFVGGTANVQVGAFQYSEQPSWFTLSKIDSSNEFSHSWTRYYGGDAHYNMFGLLATSDGGVLMYGSKFTKHGTIDAEAYILKVDDNGNTTYSGQPHLASADLFQLTPNPVSTNALAKSKIWPYTLEIFTPNGQIITSMKINVEEYWCDFSNLPSGIYFFQARIGQGLRLFSGKFCKM